MCDYLVIMDMEQPMQNVPEELANSVLRERKPDALEGLSVGGLAEDHDVAGAMRVSPEEGGYYVLQEPGGFEGEGIGTQT